VGRPAGKGLINVDDQRREYLAWFYKVLDGIERTLALARGGER